MEQDTISVSPEQLITIKVAAEKTGLADKTIRNWIDEGRLKLHIVNDKAYVIKKEMLLLIPTVLSIYNQKGGVGKTTSSVLLADFLDTMGYKILLVDLDPQASLTDVMIGYEKDRMTIYDNLEHNTMLEKIAVTYNERIDILPASIRMASKSFMYEADLIEKKEQYYKFFKKYQIVLIDCPPSMSSFSRFGVLLANFVLIPLEAHPLCYDGLDEALKQIGTLKKMNSDFLDFYGFMNKYEGVETSLAKTFYKYYQDDLKEHLLEYKIKKSVDFSDRTAQKKNLFSAKKNSITEIENLFNQVLTLIYDKR